MSVYVKLLNILSFIFQIHYKHFGSHFKNRCSTGLFIVDGKTGLKKTPARKFFC